MNFIYEYDYALSDELCQDIINLYEQSDDKYDGVTGGGMNKAVKDTTDLIINSNNEQWKNIADFLKNELIYNLKQYMDNINFEYKKHNYELFDRAVDISNFMVQKYEKNVGKYIYHNDFSVDHDTKKHRILTYIFYLNTVETGGETEFLNEKIKIKPKTGKLLFFPAFWTYPHRGVMPVSSDKYIITGWIYNFKKQ
jgi:hypothetical protein